MTLDTAKTLAEWVAAFKAEHWRSDLKPSEALHRVRVLLSTGGWAEPFSVGAALCLDDALTQVAPSPHAAVLLELELQRQLRASPRTDTSDPTSSLSAWLQARGRTIAEVLQLLAVTARRLANEESRHV